MSLLNPKCDVQMQNHWFVLNPSFWGCNSPDEYWHLGLSWPEIRIKRCWCILYRVCVFTAHINLAHEHAHGDGSKLHVSQNLDTKAWRDSFSYISVLSKCVFVCLFVLKLALL